MESRNRNEKWKAKANAPDTSIVLFALGEGYLRISLLPNKLVLHNDKHTNLGDSTY